MCTRAKDQNIVLFNLEEFEAIPGIGVQARIDGRLVTFGSHRMISGDDSFPLVDKLEAQGKTALFVASDGKLAGALAAADTLRPEVPEALAGVGKLGIQKIELLTGDNEQTASLVAEKLGIGYRANLLSEEKIAIVKSYQAKGQIGHAVTHHDAAFVT